MRLKAIVALAALSLLALPACTATIRDGPVGGVVDVVEGPAIVLVERQYADGFREAAASLDGVTRAEARAIATDQAAARQRLEVARIAYDVTLGLTSSFATRAIVTAARQQTDDAFAAFGRAVAPLLIESSA